MATQDRTHLAGKPPGEFIGHNREEAVEQVEHARSRGLIAWLEEDFARGMASGAEEFMGYRLFTVDPQVPVIPNGEWTTEPHTTMDKRFVVQGPGDVTLYVDYDDVDHVEVDRTVAAMIDRLNRPVVTLREDPEPNEYGQSYIDAVESIVGGEVPAEPGSAHLAGVTDAEWIENKIREAVGSEQELLAAKQAAQMATVRESMFKAQTAMATLKAAGIPLGKVLPIAESIIDRTAVLLGEILEGSYERNNPDWRPGA